MNSASKPHGQKELVRVPKIFSSADRALAPRIKAAEAATAWPSPQRCSSQIQKQRRQLNQRWAEDMRHGRSRAAE